MNRMQVVQEVLDRIKGKFYLELGVDKGESFTSMYNLSSTLFVLEMETLLEEEITAQVEAFISGTV
jgi:hypothetical protein